MRYWQPKIRSVRPGEWIQFDGSRRIARIRLVEVSSPPKQLLRAEVWAGDGKPGEFLGYFPVDELRLAAECIWMQYRDATAAPEEDETVVARPEPASGTPWHPLLNAEERAPGIWTMVDSAGQAYGRVLIVREGDAVVYVTELRGERLDGRHLRLREAVERVHQAYVASHSRRDES